MINTKYTIRKWDFIRLIYIPIDPQGIVSTSIKLVLSIKMVHGSTNWCQKHWWYRRSNYVATCIDASS